MNLAKVRHGASSRRTEAELKIGRLTLRSSVEILFDSAALFILMSLHARGQFGGREASLSVRSDSLLSFMFIFLHHHLETGYKNSPWDDSGAELGEHVLIDVVGKV